ncbi:MAG TPA: hypothetical protein VMT34_13180, partial [Aggregatilineales bacterium]|nr:hypothetical protein [Aggregatilineales bacterium]
HMDDALNRAFSYQFPGRQNFLKTALQGVTLRFLVKEVAAASKITARAVVKELHDGKTMMQILTEHSADSSMITADAIAMLSAQLNKLVAQKNLSQDEANNLIATLQSDLTDALNRVNPLTSPLFVKSASTTTPPSTAQP